MEYFKKFKSDKKFQRNVIMIIIVGLFFLNSNILESQTYIPICAGVIESDYDRQSCERDGCAIVYASQPNKSELDRFVNWLSCLLGNCQLTFCQTKGTVGDYISASSESSARWSCVSGEASLWYETNWNDGYDVWKCSPDNPLTPQPTSPICKSWQQPFADFMSFKFADGWGCSTKAYATIFMGIAVVLAVV